ncbi:MAG: CDP-alcohol phosphatidyltransferase family protein [Eubacterium sp.]|nr:CDP-alcohol phosphatidyltransferase family protein [Eubacterium sp.]
MANILTISRIIFSIMLLLFPAFSPTFYFLYLIAGFTDMIDGTIARKTNSVSEFGSKLDSIADFIFIAVCFIRLIPILNIPTFLWIWIILIVIIKVINVISGYIIRKEFVVKHTILNKITGALLFIFPLTVSIIDIKYSGIAICTIATLAAAQEGHLIRSSSLSQD